MAVSKRLRFEIFRRDNHACRYCGAAAPDVKLTVDHVTPVALGGTDEPGNLVTACADCNSGKTSSSPDAPIVEDVEQDAIRWAQANRRAAELQALERQAEQEFIDYVDHAWCDGIGPGGLPRPNDWQASTLAFRRAGLTAEEVADALYIAMSKMHISAGRVWRYACGICWRRLEERQQMARDLLATEED